MQFNMKKVYIKPDIEEIFVESLQLMAASTPGFGEGEAWEDALSKEHNPSMGYDVWDDWGADDEE